MVGLHARLNGRGGLLGTIGVLLAWVVVAASVVNLVGLALPIPTPGEPDAPILLRITYMVAFLGILIGLLALGIAALRAEVLSPPWSGVPLAVGVLWFPLQGIGFVISDGVGLILGDSPGCSWDTSCGQGVVHRLSNPRGCASKATSKDSSSASFGE